MPGQHPKLASSPSADLTRKPHHVSCRLAENSRLRRRLLSEKSRSLKYPAILKRSCLNFWKMRPRMPRHVSNSILTHMPSPGGEQWVAQGLALANDAQCPFCGQGVAGLDLLDAYKKYFSQAYAALKGLHSASARAPQSHSLGSLIEEIY